MAPISFEEFLLAQPQTPRTRGPKPNLVAKFALAVATGGLMLWSGHRRLGHHHPDPVFQFYLFANLITFILGLLMTYVSTVAPPHSTTTGGGKIMMWATLFMSVVTFVLGSYLLIFANWWAALDQAGIGRPGPDTQATLFPQVYLIHG